MNKLFFLIFSLISVGVHAQTQITSATQLQSMSLDGNYILMNDIDLSSTTLNPIGGKSGSFTGTFDGNGYTIKLGNINSSYQYRGLFSQIGSTGVVKNLNVTGQYIQNYIEDYSYVGVIAARNTGTITNCNTSVGINSSGVSGTGKMTYSGGIAGYNSGTISYCFASGNIYGGSYNMGTGGIVGNNSGNNAKIENCIYIGEITKHSGDTGNKLGMICGYAETDNSKQYITNDYYIEGKGFTGLGSYSTSSPTADDGHCTALDQYDIRALARTGGIYVSTTTDVFKSAILTFPYEISFYESDGIGAFSNIIGEPANVTFHRAFHQNVKCTICLPFDISSDKAAAYGKFYTFAGLKAGTTDVVQMQEVTTDLTANTAYVFESMPYSHSEELGITFKNVTISNTLMPLTSSSEFQFIGTYANKSWSEGDTDLGKVYGFAIEGYESEGFTEGQFVKLGAGASATPFKAYLKYTGSGNISKTEAPRRAIEQTPDVFYIEWISKDGSTTGINAIKSLQNETWYNIDGRKLNAKPKQKGIYIHNGKKVIIK